MKTPSFLLTLTTGLLLACSANAADRKPTGITAEIQQEMAQAHSEVRADLAQARRELDTENLSLGDSLRFGEKSARRTNVPHAEITPAGDFLIEGKPQDITITQRRQLLAYRGLVVDIGKAGIDIGERSAEAALDAVGNRSLLGLMFGAMSGSLERRIERLVYEEVGPAVRGICKQLPRVRASQQRLASSLPQFRPYATLDAADIEDCHSNVRDEFASL